MSPQRRIAVGETRRDRAFEAAARLTQLTAAVLGVLALAYILTGSFTRNLPRFIFVLLGVLTFLVVIA